MSPGSHEHPQSGATNYVAVLQAKQLGELCRLAALGVSITSPSQATEMSTGSSCTPSVSLGARSAVRAGLSAVSGETEPSGPRRIASVVTPNVTAIRQASPKAGSNAEM